MAVTPITIQLPIPVWMPMVINHTPYVEVETQADIPNGATVYQPFTLAESEDEIEITENGGLLPADDSLIMVTSNIGGAILPGVSDGEWQADRVSVPNKIVLNTPAVVGFSGVVAMSV